MRIYLSKKWLKGITFATVLVIAAAILLRIVFIWDQKQGVVDAEKTHIATPPQYTNEKTTPVSKETDETTDVSASEPVKDEKKPLQESADESRVDLIISKIYDLRLKYLNKISGLEAEAKAGEKGLTVDERLSFIEGIIDKATALEEECDAQMNVYIQELQAELIRLGRDMSMVSEVRVAYQQEKQEKKSQLFNKYNKYLE